uniref:Uncharacterized protein n=1 Tax=uncultured Poseidoniia archaeon TaxID=1697135 RepID=A0A1B1TAB1_9ARCH|nr:hypothetical protein [uncultured Candidatus Thalassoarchaea sp.]
MSDYTFTADDLRDYQKEHGFEERLACPICRFNIKPITKEDELNFRGFSKNVNPESDGGLILAKYGICANLHRENENLSFSYYGVPLILESELEDSKIEIDYSEIDEKPFDENLTVQGPSNDTWLLFKTKITKAVGDHKYQLTPPYQISQYIYSYTGDDSSDKYEESENHNPKNEWFEVLGPSLWEMRNLKHDKARIIQHILPTIYLHKTTIMNNIEPFWIFMGRFGLGLQSVEVSMVHYPHILPPKVARMVAIMQDYAPERSTIESFTYMSRNNKLLGNLPNDELRKIIDESCIILEKLKSTKYRSETIFEMISKEQIISDNLTLGNVLMAPVGIIEGLCVYGALLKIRPKVAEDFFTNLYPREPAAIWKWSLTEFGQKFGDIGRMKKLIHMTNK